MDFTIRDLLCGLLEGQDSLPGDEELDEPLAKVAQRLHFLIFRRFAGLAAPLAFLSLSFVRGPDLGHFALSLLV